MMRAVLVLLISSVIVNLSACRRPDYGQAYRDLYLTRYGVDFPSDPSSVESCLASGEAKCREVYERAKKAKQVIVSSRPTVALNDALNTVAERCSPEHIDAQLCEGALVSFYFYTDPTQDEILLVAVKKYPAPVQSMIFGYSPYAWFSNRPQPKPWVDFIQTLPDSLFPRASKLQVLKAFQEPGQSQKHGVALL